MEEVLIESAQVQSHPPPVSCKTIWGLSFKFSSTAWCKATVNLVWTLQNSGSWKEFTLIYSALLCLSADSLGMVSSSVLLRTTVDSCSRIPVYPSEFIWKRIWLIQSPCGLAVLSQHDESYFLLLPYSDSWCVLLTSHTSAQTSSMYRSPSLKSLF